MRRRVQHRHTNTLKLDATETLEKQVTETNKRWISHGATVVLLGALILFKYPAVWPLALTVFVLGVLLLLGGLVKGRDIGP